MKLAFCGAICFTAAAPSNGQQKIIGDRRRTVLLEMYNDQWGIFINGGVLISDKWILTTGHSLRNFVLKQKCERKTNFLHRCEVQLKYDDGGPLIALNENDVATLVGTMTFRSGNGSNIDLPTGYMRTEAHLDWIHEMTGIVVD